MNDMDQAPEAPALVERTATRVAIITANCSTVISHCGREFIDHPDYVPITGEQFDAVASGKILKRDAIGGLVLTDRVIDYRERRAGEYPDLGDQLDVLYKAMTAGVLPMVPEFYNPISAVKAKYPKPALASEP